MDGNKLDLILQELKKHTEVLQSHTEMLQGHTQELKKHTKQFESIEKRLTNIEPIVNKGVYEDIIRLESRIEVLEKKQVI